MLFSDLRNAWRAVRPGHPDRVLEFPIHDRKIALHGEQTSPPAARGRRDDGLFLSALEKKDDGDLQYHELMDALHRELSQRMSQKPQPVVAEVRARRPRLLLTSGIVGNANAVWAGRIRRASRSAPTPPAPSPGGLPIEEFLAVMNGGGDSATCRQAHAARISPPRTRASPHETGLLPHLLSNRYSRRARRPVAVAVPSRPPRRRPGTGTVRGAPRRERDRRRRSSLAVPLVAAVVARVPAPASAVAAARRPSRSAVPSPVSAPASVASLPSAVATAGRPPSDRRPPKIHTGPIVRFLGSSP